jgi:competence protein ComEC
VGPVELLKVGHHGSATATGRSFLEELKPLAAVVSSGPNRYGHPAPETLGRLQAAGVDVWRTDREGTVTVLVDDEVMRIRGRRGERRYPLR